MTTEGRNMDKTAIATVERIGGRVRPPFTHFRQPTGRETPEGKPEIIDVGEIPRALALIESGLDPVDACEQVLDERVADNARVIRARDGDPYPSLDSYLPEGERRKRVEARVAEEFGDKPPAADPAALKQAQDDLAAKDAEIEALRRALEEATAPPANSGPPPTPEAKS